MPILTDWERKTYNPCNNKGRLQYPTFNNRYNIWTENQYLKRGHEQLHSLDGLPRHVQNMKAEKYTFSSAHRHFPGPHMLDPQTSLNKLQKTKYLF